MKLRNCALGLVVGGMLGCGGNNAGPATTERPMLSKGTTETTAVAANNGGSGQQARPTAVNIPKDARWTIFCATFSGPDHLAQGKAAREKLAQSTGMRDWYLVTADGRSTLYYGYYRSINDPKDSKESQRAQQDRKSIATIKDGMGRSLFATALLVELDSADPASKPEWDLENAKGAYTVQVAVYKGSNERKQAALEAVKQARAMGYPAYYYHGPTASSVCIGTWPKEAVKLLWLNSSEREEINVKHLQNPNAVPVVVPGGTKVADGALTPDGRPISVVQSQYEVLDPTLTEVLKQFPIHSLNGAEEWEVADPRTGQKRRVRYPSRVVKIPTKEGEGPAIATGVQTPEPVTGAPGQPADPVVRRPNPEQVPTPQRPAQPAGPKGGKLKSLED